MISAIREKIKKESNRVNSIVAIVILLLFIWLLVDLYFDLGGHGDPLGTVSYKSNKTNRKYNARNTWNDLNLNSNVYNLDTIRTDDMSKMTITFNDKTEVLIDENSMVILNLSGNSMNINLINGGIQLNSLNSTGSIAGNFKINSGESEIKLNKGALKLNKSYNSVIDVDVQEGKAEFKKGDTKQEIGKNEQLKIRGDKIHKTQRKFRLLSPINSSVFQTTQKQESIIFEWEGEEKNYILEIYSLSGGIKKILEQKLNTYSFSRELPPGKYSWKLSDEKKTDTITEVFFISDENSVRPLTPPEGDRIYYVQEFPKILFSWNRNEFTPVYQLEISKTRDFVSTVVKFETLNESTVIDSLGEGKYYYRIISRKEFSDPNPKISRTQSFTINRQEGPSKPQLLSPENFAQFISSEKVRFAWKSQEEFSHFRIQISKEKNFASVFKVMEVETNSINWQEPFSDNDYYWRVEGKVKGTQTWITSDIRKFQITDKPKVLPIITLETPENHEEIIKESIQFSWKTNSGKPLTFELSDSPEFSKTIKAVSTTKQNLTIPSLKKGQYYWRLKATLEDDIYHYSDVFSFHLPGFESPIIEEPKSPANFDVLQTRTAIFKWGKLENIQSYSIEVWMDKDKVLSDHTNKNEWKIENLTNLKPGVYNFKLSAVYTGKDGKQILSKPAVVSFKVFLSRNIQKEEIKFKTPDTIYIE